MSETKKNKAASSTPSEPRLRAGATVSDGARILDSEAAESFALGIAESLVDDKCTDVIVIDVRGVSPVTGYIVIGSGTSARQMGAALDHLDEVAEAHGTKVFKVSTDNDSLWLLADFVDVVVHLFEPGARAHYDLEMLWSDGKRVQLPEDLVKRMHYER
ncbi:MAG: ribosome silencing factor [Phycisphaerales bacterium]|nr:ribosome silencing factor [Phycisphaerales bacterium]